MTENVQLTNFCNIEFLETKFIKENCTTQIFCQCAQKSQATQFLVCMHCTKPRPTSLTEGNPGSVVCMAHLQGTEEHLGKNPFWHNLFRQIPLNFQIDFLRALSKKLSLPISCVKRLCFHLSIGGQAH